MRSKFLPALVLLFACGVSAQTNVDAGGQTVCRVPVSKSPAVRGIRLGMSAAELLALFGKSDDAQFRALLEGDKRPPGYGLAEAGFSPSNYPGARGFSGVRNIYVHLFDRRVFSFFIQYDGPSQTQLQPWGHVDLLIEKVAKAFDLPGAGAWSPPNAQQRKELRCDGFTVTADVSSSCCPSLTLESAYPKEQVEGRMRAAQEKAREGFVP